MAVVAHSLSHLKAHLETGQWIHPPVKAELQADPDELSLQASMRPEYRLQSEWTRDLLKYM